MRVLFTVALLAALPGALYQGTALAVPQGGTRMDAALAAEAAAAKAVGFFQRALARLKSYPDTTRPPGFVLGLREQPSAEIPPYDHEPKPTPQPMRVQFQPAVPGYHFQFPRDYFDHPKFQTEWWYYSGNLSARDGKKFGFELAFFRFGASHPMAGQPPWQIRNMYMAHLALSDLRGRRFLYHERLNRGGPGLAGASQAEQRVWNGNWQVEWRGDTEQLQAVSQDFSLHLTLVPLKPPVLNGHDGFSQKAPGRGNASYYFSLTRLATNGVVTIEGRQYTLSGTSWLDHEFYTSPETSPVTGWDWICLQLDDDTELMLYRVRLKNGEVSPDSSGTYTDSRGQAHHIDLREFSFEPGKEVWRSPTSGARYPSQWSIAVHSLRLRLNVTTPLKNQELASRNPFSPTYWEGAVRTEGEEAGKTLHGIGYLEMTGYAKPLSNAGGK
jgi:predicted secreted hydrolase